MTYKR